MKDKTDRHPSDEMTRHLGVLAKYWQPGKVKTRLAAHIGHQAAANLQHHFVQVAVQRYAHIGDDRVIAFTPDEQRLQFEELISRLGMDQAWRLDLQADGSLGDRMQHCFSQAFLRGHQRVVLLGSDSPNLPLGWIEQAFQWLETVPVVLGPTTDGGYYLIGAQQPIPPIFDGVAWSSPSVYRDTITRLENASCPYRVLPSWYDIDQYEDLVRLANDLAHNQVDDRSDDSLLRKLTDVVALTIQGLES